ncbi:hypothetical protein PPERSA_06811 [Pseudocohnilembus persalinus]|uniref:Uncharacterized protein n=1 Tax=Pseudocohnilembus persalinus TaxID=266149 RepID=A0A0V0QS79_PSEPJ|nr:hypothetical protein PPERSA_06811 [Pseudocohnilembus persalinus]|eukprot:KRX05177.1 hypothetical protein PPERSA_06811 [Pseudocohnilembus persalinus]
MLNQLANQRDFDILDSYNNKNSSNMLVFQSNKGNYSNLLSQQSNLQTISFDLATEINEQTQDTDKINKFPKIGQGQNKIQRQQPQDGNKIEFKNNSIHLENSPQKLKINKKSNKSARSVTIDQSSLNSYAYKQKNDQISKNINLNECNKKKKTLPYVMSQSQIEEIREEELLSSSINTSRKFEKKQDDKFQKQQQILQNQLQQLTDKGQKKQTDSSFIDLDQKPTQQSILKNGSASKQYSGLQNSNLQNSSLYKQSKISNFKYLDLKQYFRGSRSKTINDQEDSQYFSKADFSMYLKTNKKLANQMKQIQQNDPKTTYKLNKIEAMKKLRPKSEIKTGEYNADRRLFIYEQRLLQKFVDNEKFWNEDFQIAKSALQFHLNLQDKQRNRIQNQLQQQYEQKLNAFQNQYKKQLQQNQKIQKSYPYYLKQQNNITINCIKQSQQAQKPKTILEQIVIDKDQVTEENFQENKSEQKLLQMNSQQSILTQKDQINKQHVNSDDISIKQSKQQLINKNITNIDNKQYDNQRKSPIKYKIDLDNQKQKYTSNYSHSYRYQDSSIDQSIEKQKQNSKSIQYLQNENLIGSPTKKE